MAKEGILSQVSKFEVMGLPLGAVASGAIVGGAGDAIAGVVTGFAPQAPTWSIKGGLAFLVAKYGKNLIGAGAAQVGALFLTYDAVQELFNIRASMANIISGITGKVVKQSPPRFTGSGGAAAVGSSSYYSKAMGGK